jgi:hypothetical protein
MVNRLWKHLTAAVSYLHANKKAARFSAELLFKVIKGTG